MFKDKLKDKLEGRWKILVIVIVVSLTLGIFSLVNMGGKGDSTEVIEVESEIEDKDTVVDSELAKEYKEYADMGFYAAELIAEIAAEVSKESWEDPYMTEPGSYKADDLDLKTYDEADIVLGDLSEEDEEYDEEDGITRIIYYIDSDTTDEEIREMLFGGGGE